MPFTLTRQQFYDVLWSAPMKQLRPVFGLSDVMIGRIARAGQVPLPGIGYWRKVETGSPRPKRDKLAYSDLLTQDLYSFPGTLTPEVNAMFSGDPGEGEPEEAVEILAERLRKRIGTIKVHSDDRSFHPDIKRMRDRDLKRSWGGVTYSGYVGGRALAVASALFLKAEELGCRPYVRTDYDQFNFDLGIGMIGSLKIRMDRANLRLSIGPADIRFSDGLGIKTFTDTEITPIERRLPDIMLEYATQGERNRRRFRDEDLARRAADAERRQQDLERQEREAEAAYLRKQESDRLAKIASAVAKAQRWRDAELLRKYAAAYVQRFNDNAAAEHHAWLLSVADEIDPMLAEREAS